MALAAEWKVTIQINIQDKWYCFNRHSDNLKIVTYVTYAVFVNEKGVFKFSAIKRKMKITSWLSEL